MSERKIRKLKERVARSLARQDYEAALESAQKILELDPKDDRTQLKIGELYQRLGETAQALIALRKVADFYSKDGRLVRAISVLKMILDLDPQDTATAKQLALLYSARGLPPSKAVRAMLTEKEHAVSHAAPVTLRVDPSPAPPSSESQRPPTVAAEPIELEPLQAGERFELDDGRVLGGTAATTDTAPKVAPKARTEARTPPPPKSGDALKPTVVSPVAASRSLGDSSDRAKKFLEVLAAEEDPFALSHEEEAREQLAAAEFKALDLDELDLAFVELAADAGPQMPHTPLFSDLAPDELHALLSRVRRVPVHDGEAVVRQGEAGASIFVVSDGKLEVCVAPPEGSSSTVAFLEEGDFFGEFGMLTDGQRHATVLALGPVELLEIHHDDLMAICRSHPRVRKVLAEFYRKRAMETALAGSRVFGALERSVREQLAKACAEERHQADSTVLQEGDSAEGIFLVKRGRLQVISSGIGADSVTLAELQPGDFFGEISTLNQTAVTANVVTLEASELLKISTREVLEFCGDHPQIREALASIGSARLHESINRISESGLV